MSAITGVLAFLISMAFSLITLLLWLRVAVRFFHVSSLNPVCLSIYRLTNPLVEPLAKILPENWKSNRYDYPALMVLILLEVARLILMGFVLFGRFFPIPLMLLYIPAALVIVPCNLLFYAIIARVIVSWIGQGWRHPLLDILYAVTEPVLAWWRKLLPEFGGIDFSPLAAVIMLKAIVILVSGLLPLKII